MIRTEALTVSLGGQPVLRDISLAFSPGRVTVLLGPNGAGKSSLLRAVAGLLPSDGIYLGDRPYRDLALEERARRIAYLPQNGAPAWNITARELVALGRLPYRSRFAAETAEDRAKIEAALTATDTAHIANRTVNTLSGGELARAKLARLLAADPEWLFADEPLANLDPAHQRDMLRLLRRAASEGKGVIVVLHQLDAARHIADEVVLLKDGEILASGAANDHLTPANLGRLFETEFTLLNDGSSQSIRQIW